MNELFLFPLSDWTGSNRRTSWSWVPSNAKTSKEMVKYFFVVFEMEKSNNLIKMRGFMWLFLLWRDHITLSLSALVCDVVFHEKPLPKITGQIDRGLCQIVVYWLSAFLYPKNIFDHLDLTLSTPVFPIFPNFLASRENLNPILFACTWYLLKSCQKIWLGL